MFPTIDQSLFEMSIFRTRILRMPPTIFQFIFPLSKAYMCPSRPKTPQPRKTHSTRYFTLPFGHIEVTVWFTGSNLRILVLWLGIPYKQLSAPTTVLPYFTPTSPSVRTHCPTLDTVSFSGFNFKIRSALLPGIK